METLDSAIAKDCESTTRSPLQKEMGVIKNMELPVVCIIFRRHPEILLPRYSLEIVVRVEHLVHAHVLLYVCMRTRD